MTGHQPKIEKTCGTCLHEDACASDEAGCWSSEMFPDGEWEPKPLVPPTGGSSATKLEEGMIRKGGRNTDPSQVSDRPPAPGAISVPPTPSAAAMIEATEAEIRDRVRDLLEANNRYLQRARDAKARVAELERNLADSDAALIAMEARAVAAEAKIVRAFKIIDGCPEPTSDTIDEVGDALLYSWKELGGEGGANV